MFNVIKCSRHEIINLVISSIIDVLVLNPDYFIKFLNRIFNRASRRSSTYTCTYTFIVILLRYYVTLAEYITWDYSPTKNVIIYMHTYGSMIERGSSSFNFPDAWHVANISYILQFPRELCRVIQENRADRDTVARKINVRGISRAFTNATSSYLRRHYNFCFFLCSEHTASVIGTRIYTRARSLAISCAPFHFLRRARARDRSLFASPGDLWKLIETCIHHRSIGKLSVARRAAYVSRK